MTNQQIASFGTLQQYNETVRTLRTFFLSKNFIEVDAQSRRSILAACEDPFTISTYTFNGVKWPLPQTGQMWLEHDLLKNPMVPGLFCLTTSYRNEPNPDPARHLQIFPMFEFETHGTQDTLAQLIMELCEFLGFGPQSGYHTENYETIAQRYHSSIVGAKEEAQLANDYGSVFLLKNFPFRSSPFWNMKKEGDYAKKIDTILYGVETIGAAERSCHPAEMREQFYTISNGAYAQLLFKEFGRERVEAELNEFLSLDFFPRFGGGIGVHRMIRARELLKQQAPLYRGATQVTEATMQQ